MGLQSDVYREATLATFGIYNFDNGFGVTAHIERSTNGVDFVEIGTVSVADGDIASFSDTDLIASDTPYYRVRGEVNGQYSAYSSVIQLDAFEEE